MALFAEQLDFDFFSAPESAEKTDKPDWLVKAEKLVSTLVGLPQTTYHLPRNRYESVTRSRDYSGIDTTRTFHREISLEDAGYLNSGEFIVNKKGKARLLTDEDALIISSHLAKQGFLVTQYPDGKHWRFQKKFWDALKSKTLVPFPEPLKDYSESIYTYFHRAIESCDFDPHVRNLGDSSVKEVEKPEHFSKWYRFEPFIKKLLPERTNPFTVGQNFNQYLKNNHYLDFDPNIVGSKTFFSEKFKKDMKQGTLAPLPTNLAVLEPYKKAVFNEIGRVFRIDTPDLIKERVERIKAENEKRYNRDGNRKTYAAIIRAGDIIAKEKGAEDKIRPELHHAWADTIDTIRASAMHQRMTKKSDYWNSKIEEAARSFEGFVEVRSKELGIQNDFLTNAAFSEKEKGKDSYYPYLDGEDVAKVCEKFKTVFDVIKTRETEKGVALFSKTREARTGAKVSEIQSALEKKFGKTTIDGLIKNGRLKIVADIEEAKERLSFAEKIKNSKKNLRTGYVVPDELAHKNNPEGIIATLKLKDNLKFPSGKIIVKEGYHVAFQHRGFGARHLTGNILEHPSRDLYKDEKNKTEAALKSLKDIFTSSTELFRITNNQFVFYSSKYKLGVPCLFDEGKDTFVVTTMTPVSNKYGAWGNDSVRLSGALETPDYAASVTASSLVPDIGRDKDGTQPVKAHEDLYTDVDYTTKIALEIQRAKTRYRSEDIEGIQGLYSSDLKASFLIANNLSSQSAPAVLLHEVGVHMAYDSSLRSKVVPLVNEAPRLLKEGFTQRDPVCLAAELRLNDSKMTPDHPNYAEEAAAYLVEECAKQRSQLPAVQRWYKEVRSTVNVWLIDHGFKDTKSLTTDDFVTIAKSNLKALSEQKEINAEKSQDQSEKILFSVNKEHRKILDFLKEELPKANPVMKNPALLSDVLQTMAKKMHISEQKGEILKLNDDFMKQITAKSKNKALER